MRETENATGSTVFPSLYGVRAIVALFPPIYHFQPVVPGTKPPLRQMGPFAVEVFFVLSGFLIAGRLMATLDTRRASFGRFYTKFFVNRAGRIWPLCMAFVAYLCVTDWFIHYPATNARPWMMATFLENFDIISHNRWNTRSAPNALWSVCIEEHAYLLLPLLLYGAQKMGLHRLRTLGILFGIALASVGTRYVLAATTKPVVWYVCTFSRLDGILIGAMAAWIHRYRTTWISRGVALVAIVLTAWKLFTLNDADVWNPRANPGHSLFRLVFFDEELGSIGAACLILSLVTNQLPRGARMLSWSPLRIVGEVSYGIYLLHMVVRELVYWNVPPTAITWVGGEVMRVLLLMATVLAAYVSWRWFEAPFTKAGKEWQPPPWLDAWFSRREVRTTASAGAALSAADPG